MQQIRFGVIGTGMMGVEHICTVNAIGARDGSAVVVATADPADVPRRWGVEASGGSADAYSDHLALLARNDVDAVVVASPNYTHRDVLADVFRLRPDLHVLCEKPLCTTVQDARAVADAVAAHRGIFWVGMEYRYMAPVAHLAAAVHAGEIGTPRMVAIREHRYPFLPKVGDWNRFSRNTGGTLVEKCCHFFDLMHLVAGAEPVRVFASGGQDVNHLDERYDGDVPDIIDNAFCVVEFANGVRGMLDLCMFAEGSRNEQEVAVTGDAGKIESLIPEHVVVRAPRRGSVTVTDVPVSADVAYRGFHHGATWGEQVAFLQAVRDGTTPEVTARDGLRAVLIGAAAEESVRTGLPVTLPSGFRAMS
jgi:myo-inositol 2-dehydrogenase/D-chiro-inositol 1-dehydrogenase